MSATEAEDRYMTPSEAAEMLSVSTQTLRKYTRSGDVPSVRLGGLVRYSRAAIVEHLNSTSIR